MPITCFLEEAGGIARDFKVAFDMYKEGYSALLAIGEQGILSKWHDFRRERDEIWEQTVGLEARKYRLAEREITPLRPFIAFEISCVYMEFDLENPYRGIHRVHERRNLWTLWLEKMKVRGNTVLRYDSIMSEDYV